MTAPTRGASRPTHVAEPGPDDDAGRALNVLIVDDHALMRTALRLLLETCLDERVVEASSAEEAIEMVLGDTFDIVLMDVRMPGRDGLWALSEIRRLRPELPVVMLSYFADESSVREALDGGASGYLVKGAEVHQVQDCMTTAISKSGVYVHPMAVSCMVGRRSTGAVEELTRRELDVLELLVEGATNDEIAKRLFVTEKTVKTHISGVFRKLCVTNRTQAATKALREGMVVPGDPVVER